MSTKVTELNSRLEQIEKGGLSARGRIGKLLDPGSFIETGAFVKQRNTDFTGSGVDAPADGVVCGYGTIDGRLVYVYSQDKDTLGGSIGEMHAKKIESVYAHALKMGAPVIGLIDSKGVRLNENVDALDAYGRIFAAMSSASGVVPQISVILGDCIGGLTFIPALSDFVFMTEKDSQFFISSPNTIPGSEGRLAAAEKMGSGLSHAQSSGLIHFLSKDEDDALSGVRNLFAFLPSNNMEESPLFETNDDLNRLDEALNQSCESESIDVAYLLNSISDGHLFLEVQKEYAKAVITGFARFNGFTAGIVANNAKESSLLCSRCISKATAFVDFCNAFNIPILSVTDVSGFKPSYTEEINGIIKSSAKLVYAFASATVPKINLIVNQAFGSAYILMNSKHIGADMVFAWPSAKISVMDAETAVSIMASEEIKAAGDAVQAKQEMLAKYKQNQESPYTSASRGYIDSVIEPSQTRKYIVSAMESLASKRVLTHAKKQGSFY